MTAESARDDRAVLLDIEGTTTPIAFVYETLFPFARAGLADWSRRHAGSGDHARVMEHLAREHTVDRSRGERVPPWDDATPDAAIRSLQAYAFWLMDADRKSPGLKLLQGLIWDEGYRAGTLRGEVYPDVAPAMRRWHAAKIRIAIYSSGSERAQRRLFESTPDGDLTTLIDAFFDTGVGPKLEAGSYAAIAARLAVAPRSIAFVSDVTAELAASVRAGCRAILCVRDGNRPQPDADAYRRIKSFDELDVQDL